MYKLVAAVIGALAFLLAAQSPALAKTCAKYEQKVTCKKYEEKCAHWNHSPNDPDVQVCTRYTKKCVESVTTMECVEWVD